MSYNGTHTIQILNIGDDVSEIVIDLTSDELAVINRISNAFYESEVKHMISGDVNRYAPLLKIIDITQMEIDRKNEEARLADEKAKKHEENVIKYRAMAVALKNVGLI